MEIWKKRTTNEINLVLLQEIAKSQAEIKTAQADIQKASNRLSFCLTALNELKSRNIKE
jgi:hypothetical protein